MHHQAWALTPVPAQPPLLPALFAAYEAAKQEADRLETDEAGGKQIDAFYAMLEAECRSPADVSDKARLVLRNIEQQKMTVDEEEFKTFLRAVGGSA